MSGSRMSFAKSIINTTKQHVIPTTSPSRLHPVPLSTSSYLARYHSTKPTIKIFEVGARDGLQSEKAIVSTDDKLELIRGLVKSHNVSGQKRIIIEAGSSVNPKVIPQLGDFEELAKAMMADPKLKDIPVSWLALGTKGVERIIDLTYGTPTLGSIGVVISPSLGFTTKNMGASSLEDMNTRLKSMMKAAHKANVAVLGYVSTAFHCPIEGFTDAIKSADCAKFLLDNGAREIAIADTTGHATQKHVIALLGRVLASGIPVNMLAAHFHDTYGTALENTLPAIEMGVTTIHSSIGGLGGCPYAKSENGIAPGNLATEDAVFGLRALGYNVEDVDLAGILDVATDIYTKLGRNTYSKTYTKLMGIPEEERNKAIEFNINQGRSSAARSM